MTVYFHFFLKLFLTFRFICILQQTKLPNISKLAEVLIFHMCTVVTCSSKRKQSVPFIVLSILRPNLTDLTPSAERISVRVIDPFTIKPLDIKTITDHTRATRGRILTVEDHYYEGGCHSSFLQKLPTNLLNTAQPGLCHWPVALGVLRWCVPIGSTAEAPCGGSC